MNSKTITYMLLIFFFVLFLGGNTLIILGHNNSLQQISETISTNGVVSIYNNYTDKPQTQYIDLSTNFSFEGKAIKIFSPGFNLYSINNVTGTLDTNTFTLSGDLSYLENSLPVKINVNNSSIDIASNSKVILDLLNTKFYVVEGSISIDNQKATPGYELTLLSGQLTLFKSDREIFKEDSYTDFTAMLENFNFYTDYFTDFEAPKLNSYSPRDKFKTTDRYLLIAGNSDANTVIFFNEQSITTDENGDFNLRYELNIGENIVKVTLSDKYANSTILNLIYYRLELPVLSLPVSAPVSYSN